MEADNPTDATMGASRGRLTLFHQLFEQSVGEVFARFKIILLFRILDFEEFSGPLELGVHIAGGKESEVTDFSVPPR